jgi:hypothetical protein
MRTAPAVLTVIASVALAACATPPSYYRPLDGGRVGAATFKVAKCSAGNCKVNVTVSDDGTNCSGQVDIQVLDVRFRGTARKGEKVEFSLPNGSPYKFVDTMVPGRSPLWIKSGTDPFASVATVQANGKKLVAELKEDRSGDLIEYGIRFARDQSPPKYCLDVDPWMVD